MADALLTVENLTKSFGEKLLFEDISFGINAGQKTALIARNGTGKTSLLNIITGTALADAGKVVFRNDVRMAYLPQNPLMNETMTVREYVFASENKYVQAVNNYEKALLNIQLSPSGIHEKQLQDAMNTMDTIGAWDYENRVKEILSRLEVNDLDKTIAMLSGGERKKIALSKVLIDDANLLILDEPTNHLDIKMIEWLEEFLSKQNLSILMVTHDRYFLDNVCHDIIEIDKGHLFHYKGTYAYYVEKKAERQEIERREIEKAKNLYRTELDWMRHMPSARGTKARARIDSFYELKDKALQRIDDHRPTLSVKTERIGGKILEMYNVSKQYEGKALVDDFTYTFKKNEKIGIVGQNGVGKSTFLNIITQALKPDSGNIIVGQTVQFGFYTQNGLTESDDRRVIEIIKDVAEVIHLENGKEMSATQFLRHFGFDDSTQYNYYGNLSGGERRRLYLLKVLMANPNFLILDEPTNDLDIYTLEILEEFLENYKGCLIIVSHDRNFMDDLVDHLFVFEGNGKIRDYHSNYTDYIKLKEQEQRIATQQKREEKPKYERTKSAAKPTYKQKQEYEQLTNEIEVLEKEKAELEQLMNSGQETDYEKLNSWATRIGEIRELIDEKELRWLELDEIMN
ncbi:MAG: ABC-F family ATP-binding cassette domain-containing protein [Bacteroidales bacterium]|nr:ABC-F family ATP-binding cassette domain-containing protein [Bacteroidales bacterium]